MSEIPGIVLGERDGAASDDERDRLKAFHLGWTLAAFQNRIELLKKQAMTLRSEERRVSS